MTVDQAAQIIAQACQAASRLALNEVDDPLRELKALTPLVLKALNPDVPDSVLENLNRHFEAKEKSLLYCAPDNLGTQFTDLAERLIDTLQEATP